MSVVLKVEFDAKKIQAELDKIPVLTQRAALESGIRPAAKVFRQRMKELTPDSSKTGSTKKWSAKTKAKRANERRLRDLTAIKMLKPKGNVAIAIVGFLWPDGNKGHLVTDMKKTTKRQVLWGRHTNQQVRKSKDSDFMRRAFDETKAQQVAAFTSGVVAAVQRRLKELGRG